MHLWLGQYDTNAGLAPGLAWPSVTRYWCWQAESDTRASDGGRTLVESAASNVHARTEVQQSEAVSPAALARCTAVLIDLPVAQLIRSMKLALLKQSMQALKQWHQAERPAKRTSKGVPGPDEEPPGTAPGQCDGSRALSCKHQGEAETLSEFPQAGRATRFFSASALDVYRRYKEGQLSFGGGKEVRSYYAAAPRSCLCPWQQPSV